jgi:hypothetical protein
MRALRLRSTLFEERPGGLDGYLQKYFFPSSEAILKRSALKALRPF